MGAVAAHCGDVAQIHSWQRLTFDESKQLSAAAQLSPLPTAWLQGVPKFRITSAERDFRLAPK